MSSLHEFLPNDPAERIAGVAGATLVIVVLLALAWRVGAALWCERVRRRSAEEQTRDGGPSTRPIRPSLPMLLTGFAAMGFSMHGLWTFGSSHYEGIGLWKVLFVLGVDGAELAIIRDLYRGATVSRTWTAPMRQQQRLAWVIALVSAALNFAAAPGDSFIAAVAMAMMPVVALTLIERQVNIELARDGEDDSAQPGPLRLVVAGWHKAWGWAFAKANLDVMPQRGKSARAAAAQRAADCLAELREALQALSAVPAVDDVDRRSRKRRTALETRVPELRAKAQAAIQLAGIADDNAQALSMLRRYVVRTRADDLAMAAPDNPHQLAVLLEDLRIVPSEEQVTAIGRAAEAEAARHGAEAARKVAEDAARDAEARAAEAEKRAAGAGQHATERAAEATAAVDAAEAARKVAEDAARDAEARAAEAEKRAAGAGQHATERAAEATAAVDAAEAARKVAEDAARRAAEEAKRRERAAAEAVEAERSAWEAAEAAKREEAAAEQRRRTAEVAEAEARQAAHAAQGELSATLGQRRGAEEARRLAEADAAGIAARADRMREEIAALEGQTQRAQETVGDLVQQREIAARAATEAAAHAAKERDAATRAEEGRRAAELACEKATAQLVARLVDGADDGHEWKSPGKAAAWELYDERARTTGAEPDVGELIAVAERAPGGESVQKGTARGWLVDFRERLTAKSLALANQTDRPAALPRRPAAPRPRTAGDAQHAAAMHDRADATGDGAARPYRRHKVNGVPAGV